MKEHTTQECERLLEQLSNVEPPPESVHRSMMRTRQALTHSTSPTMVAQEPLKQRGYRFVHSAAAIATLLAISVGGVGLLLFANPGGTSAFAQIQSAIEQLHSVSFFVEILKSPQGVVAESGTQMVDLAGNRFRFESADGADICVTDSRRGESLWLEPLQKRAVVMRSASSNMPSFAGFLDSLRNCDADIVKQLEDGTVDGQTVERYRISPSAPISDGIEMLVSVDPTTKLPVRIDCIATEASGLGPFQVVCKDFSFETRESGLFSTVPPEGYQVDKDLAPVLEAAEITTDGKQ